jgi:hypothetical protein
MCVLIHGVPVEFQTGIIRGFCCVGRFTFALVVLLHRLLHTDLTERKEASCEGMSLLEYMKAIIIKPEKLIFTDFKPGLIRDLYKQSHVWRSHLAAKPISQWRPIPAMTAFTSLMSRRGAEPTSISKCALQIQAQGCAYCRGCGPPRLKWKTPAGWTRTAVTNYSTQTEKIPLQASGYQLLIISRHVSPSMHTVMSLRA